MSLRLLYRGPRIEVLHEDYAKQGRTDAGAPVRAARSVHIDASPERVWQVLSTATEWASVDASISNVHLTDGVAVDAPFTWTNGKARVRSRFAVVDPVRELTWTGLSSGAKAVHRHVLHRADGNTTRLDSEESMAGPFLTLFYSSVKLDQGLTTWLTAVKTVAERHPRTDLDIRGEPDTSLLAGGAASPQQLAQKACRSTPRSAARVHTPAAWSEGR